MSSNKRAHTHTVDLYLFNTFTELELKILQTDADCCVVTTCINFARLHVPTETHPFPDTCNAMICTNSKHMNMFGHRACVSINGFISECFVSPLRYFIALALRFSLVLCIIWLEPLRANIFSYLPLSSVISKTTTSIFYFQRVLIVFSHVALLHLQSQRTA